METQLIYGNWIRKRILVILGVSSLVLGAASLLPLGSIYQLVTGLLFLITFISFLFPFYSYWMFSPRGGGFQDKVYTLILQYLGSPITGRVLDIGSGNGVLAVRLAQNHSEAEVVGMDYWGKDWEYSKGVCDRNAQIGGVEKRVHFQKGDAAGLEFANDTFDGVVSNLTFHEVRSAADRREVVREALRVVKVGGRFVFLDYFYNAKIYGTATMFENYLQRLNLSCIEIKPLGEVIELPLLLRHPKILGQAGIVYGRK